VSCIVHRYIAFAREKKAVAIGKIRNRIDHLKLPSALSPKDGPILRPKFGYFWTDMLRVI